MHEKQYETTRGVGGLSRLVNDAEVALSLTGSFFNGNSVNTWQVRIRGEWRHLLLDYWRHELLVAGACVEVAPEANAEEEVFDDALDVRVRPPDVTTRH